MASIDHQLAQLIPDLLQMAGDRTYANVIDLVERALISKVLKQCGYNQVKAARVLGTSRNTLRHRMKKFQISAPPGQTGPDEC